MWVVAMRRSVWAGVVSEGVVLPKICGVTWQITFESRSPGESMSLNRGVRGSTKVGG